MITCQFEKGNKANLRHAVVDTVLCKDTRILLCKRSSEVIESGKWCIPGGFIEMNETIFEAAKREMLEETGWTVKDLKLLWINHSPKRPNEDRQNIAFTFIAQADKKIKGSDIETKEIKWFGIDNLPPKEEIAFDHFVTLDLYKKYLKEKFVLPVLDNFKN